MGNLIKSFAETGDVDSTQVADLNYTNQYHSKNQNLEFDSINDFKNYINGSREILFGGTKAGKEYTAWFKFNLAFVGGVIFYVKQKITPEYEVLEVTSSDWGVTFSFSWEQSSYDSNTKDELTTINIYGKLKYNIFIEGIETVYTELKHFQVVVNNKTGKEVSGKIIY